MAGEQQEIRIDQNTFRAIRWATMVHEPRLWPDSEIDEAKRGLTKQFTKVPTLDELAEKLGAAVVPAVVRHVLESRVGEIREVAERRGHGAPCHLCAAPRDDDRDPSFEFGLAKILEEKTEWGTAGAALALNILTLPLGFAVGARPGKSTRAQIARCRLVLCAACGKKHTGFFGGLKIREHHCSQHPSWARLQQDGFDRYLDTDELAKYQ